MIDEKKSGREISTACHCWDATLKRHIGIKQILDLIFYSGV
ncbi:hypothetical protein ACNKHR_03670 [Shigella flexneri]